MLFIKPKVEKFMIPAHTTEIPIIQMDSPAHGLYYHCVKYSESFKRNLGSGYPETNENNSMWEDKPR